MIMSWQGKNPCSLWRGRNARLEQAAEKVRSFADRSTNETIRSVAAAAAEYPFSH
jgi:hypothetical protein